MRIVIDASALLATVLPEHDARLRDVASVALVDHDLLAPAVWPFEVAGGLAKAEWMQRISTETSTFIWSALRPLLASTEVDMPVDASRIFEVCRRYSLRGADATYLELAARERVALLTGDGSLARACRAADIELVYDPNA